MTVKDGVRNVLQQHGSRLIQPVPEGAGIGASPEGFLVEERGDGSATVRHSLATAGGLSDGTLRWCADVFAEAGFLVALIRDERGAYLSVS